MVYFEKDKEGVCITKWDVCYDDEELRNIRERVIEKFSYTDGIEECLIDKSHTSGEGSYQASCYEYKHPRLVELIDRLLLGDLSVLPEIENPIETSEAYYQELIEKISDEVDEIENTCVDKKIKKLLELRETMAEAQIDKASQPLSRYYELVDSVIDRYYIGLIRCEDVSRVEEFFDMDIAKGKQKSIGSR